MTSELPLDRHVDIFHQLKGQIPNLMKERSKEVKRDDVESLEKRLLNKDGNSQEEQVVPNSSDATSE